jgi:hypothetical protein
MRISLPFCFLGAASLVGASTAPLHEELKVPYSYSFVTRKLADCIKESESDFIKFLASGVSAPHDVILTCFGFGKAVPAQVHERVDALKAIGQEIVPFQKLVREQEQRLKEVAFLKMMQDPSNAERSKQIMDRVYESAIMFAVLHGDLPDARGFGRQVLLRTVETLRDSRLSHKVEDYVQQFEGGEETLEEAKRELEGEENINERIELLLTSCPQKFSDEAAARQYDEEMMEEARQALADL